MPAFRNIRRSRRISRQPPRDPNTDECDIYDLELVYPSSPSPPPASPQPLLASADDAGEPEVDRESPPLPPSQSQPHTGQRPSHSRKRDPNYIPRPPNSFMIFRSDMWHKEKIKPTVERDHRMISRIAGQLWNSMSDAERQPYHHKAEEAKRLHALAYPNYKYAPVYRKDRAGKRKVKLDQTEKVQRCKQVARLMRRGYLGDDLKKELEKRDEEGDDDYSSDASEYVEEPRRKRARRSAPKKSAAQARARHSKAAVRYEDDVKLEQEAATIPIDQSPSYDASPQPESSPVEMVDAHLPLSVDSAEDEFVHQDDIPPIDIGEPAFSCDEIQFTNPFASSSPSSAAETLSSHDPLSPPRDDFLSLSSDFLGYSGGEQGPALSSPDDAILGMFNLAPYTAPGPSCDITAEYMHSLSPPHTFFVYDDDAAPDYVSGVDSNFLHSIL